MSQSVGQRVTRWLVDPGPRAEVTVDREADNPLRRRRLDPHHEVPRTRQRIAAACPLVVLAHHLRRHRVDARIVVQQSRELVAVRPCRYLDAPRRIGAAVAHQDDLNVLARNRAALVRRRDRCPHAHLRRVVVITADACHCCFERVVVPQPERPRRHRQPRLVRPRPRRYRPLANVHVRSRHRAARPDRLLRRDVLAVVELPELCEPALRRHPGEVLRIPQGGMSPELARVVHRHRCTREPHSICVHAANPARCETHSSRSPPLVSAIST